MPPLSEEVFEMADKPVTSIESYVSQVSLLPGVAERLLNVIRTHWSIEN